MTRPIDATILAALARCDYPADAARLEALLWPGPRASSICHALTRLRRSGAVRLDPAMPRAGHAYTYRLAASPPACASSAGAQAVEGAFLSPAPAPTAEATPPPPAPGTDAPASGGGPGELERLRAEVARLTRERDIAREAAEGLRAQFAALERARDTAEEALLADCSEEVAEQEEAWGEVARALDAAGAPEAVEEDWGTRPLSVAERVRALAEQRHARDHQLAEQHARARRALSDVDEVPPALSEDLGAWVAYVVGRLAGAEELLDTVVVVRGGGR